MRFVGEEHISQSGDGIDNGADPQVFGCKGAVNVAFDGELMDEVRFFLLINGFDFADRLFFLQRIDAFAGEFDGDVTEPGLLQFLDMFPIRGEEADFPAFFFEKFGICQTKIEQVPISVRE